MKAKKHLGQHFLTSKPAVSKIISSSNLKKDDLVLEIGPGKGFLTEDLLKNCSVLAVEKDPDMVSFLKEKFEKQIKNGQLEIIEGDILKMDFDNILNNKKYKLIANIPYYITGEIIRLFLESKNKPEIITLLIQKEVAERIIAKNGKETILSLSVKFFGEPILIDTVKAGSFNPKPKVDSAIIQIKNIKQRDFEKNFFDLVKKAFSHKRKMFLANIKDDFEINPIKDYLIQNNITEKIRAEDLKLIDFLEITKIAKQKTG